VYICTVLCIDMINQIFLLLESQFVNLIVLYKSISLLTSDQSTLNTNGEINDLKDDGAEKKQTGGIVMKVSPLLDIDIPVTSVEAISKVII